jgi:hypothetical protein
MPNSTHGFKESIVARFAAQWIGMELRLDENLVQSHLIQFGAKTIAWQSNEKEE